MRILAMLASLLLLVHSDLAVAADELTGTLKKVNDTGVITLGYRESAIPFSFLNPAGRPIGYSIDFCNQIVTDLSAELGGLEIEVRYKPVTPENRIAAVQSGQID